MKFANPHNFRKLGNALLPWITMSALALLAAGLYYGLLASPEDYQQGDSVRIMYVHVPAAWMAMFVYTSMAVASLVGLVWRHTLAELYTRAVAPLGAAFTAICLVSGSLWGAPSWGTWWVWDARLTSVLVLFFLYLGYIVLVDAFDDEQRGLNAGAILVLVGAVNIPIIKFSVTWWNTLHQPPSVTRLGAPAIDGSMLLPLLLMAGAFTLIFAALAILRIRTELAGRRLKVIRMKEAAAHG